MKSNIKKWVVLFLTAALLAPTALTSYADQADGNYYKIADIPAVVEQEATITPASGKTKKSQVEGTRVHYNTLQKSLEKHRAKNKDVKAWLVVPGTNINEPVVQGKTNEYYLHRTWDGIDYPNTNWRNYQDTAIFLDKRVVLGKTWEKSSKNIVVYGHNWNNLRAPFAIGDHPQYTMFAQLPSYTDINFAKQNPYIYFSTDEMEGVWKVFAVAYTEDDIKNFPYHQPNPTTEAFTYFVQEWKKRSIYNFDVDLKKSDQILTLSTCTRNYDVGELQRYVIVARRLRPGESDKDVVKVSVNQNAKQPVWK